MLLAVDTPSWCFSFIVVTVECFFGYSVLFYHSLFVCFVLFVEQNVREKRGKGKKVHLWCLDKPPLAVIEVLRLWQGQKSCKTLFEPRKKHTKGIVGHASEQNKTRHSWILCFGGRKGGLCDFCTF